MEKKVYDLKIDPELRDYIPPLQERELEILTKRIVCEGCTEPLVVWDGVIVDGHNRYNICHQYGIPFEYREMNFEDKQAAMLWMAENQLGRRNLNTFQKIEIIVPVEEPLTKALKEKAEIRRREKISEFRKNGETVGERLPSDKTIDVVAGMADTSPRTYNKAKYLLENADRATIASLREGTLSINKAYSDMKKDVVLGENEIPEQEVTEEKNRPEPVSFIAKATEDPVTHREPQREQGSYEFVKDQVEFAIRNMIADMKVGVYCLSNEDFDKKKELKAILREGYKQAAEIIDRLEKM